MLKNVHTPILNFEKYYTNKYKLMSHFWFCNGQQQKEDNHINQYYTYFIDSSSM